MRKPFLLLVVQILSWTSLYHCRIPNLDAEPRCDQTLILLRSNGSGVWFKKFDTDTELMLWTISGIVPNRCIHYWSIYIMIGFEFNWFRPLTIPSCLFTFGGTYISLLFFDANINLFNITFYYIIMIFIFIFVINVNIWRKRRTLSTNSTLILIFLKCIRFKEMIRGF